jgi:phage tail sheath protein FI
MAEKIISPGVFQNESDQSLVQRGIQGTATAIVGPTVLGQPFVPTYVTSYSEFVSKFGETFKSGSYYYEYFTSLAAKDYFQNGGQTLLVTRVITSGSTNMSTYASSSVNAIMNANSASFVLEALTWGNIMNNTGSMTVGALASGSATNVRWEITNVNTGSGVFSLGIRAGNDNDAQKNYLETWANVSLDPAQPNYISRVIGDIKPVYKVDTDGSPYIDYTGSYANASQYVRVKSVTIPLVDSVDNNGYFKSGSLVPGQTTNYSSSLPQLGSGSATSLLGNTGGAFAGGLAATANPQLMNEEITTNNIQGFDSASYNAAFNLLANKDEYRYNVLLAPGVTLSGSVSTMISTAEGRGDAIAIVDTTLYGNVVSTAAGAAAGQSSNYAATYYPWVQVYSSGLGKAVWVPPSTVMGGVLAFNDQVGAEWFAPAGLNRGGVPSVLKAERKLTQNDRDNLYNANVNPLATFPGEGVVVFGQKTLQRKATALDRVNVRRLLIALKDFIGQVSNNLVFEQNTNITRNLFLSQVNPYLDNVVQRQGLYAYKVVMDDSNNTPDVIDRNQLVGQIYIQPTKTAEFIILNFNVLPTGATFPA